MKNKYLKKCSKTKIIKTKDEQLIFSYLPLVKKIAKNVYTRIPKHIEYNELVNAGAIGLISSIKKAKIKSKPQFFCYLQIRIKGAIIDELRKQDWLSRRMRKYVRLNSINNDAPIRHINIDEAVQYQVESKEEDVNNPENKYFKQKDKELLYKAIKQLPDREKDIVNLYYFKELKINEISKILGVSEPRISQLHQKALSILKSQLIPYYSAVAI